MSGRATMLGALVIACGLCASQAACQQVPLPSVEPGTPRDAVSVLAGGLEIPWALAFLPDGDIIITERPGRVRLFTENSGLVAEPLLELPGVAHVGEGGLLGVAVHPDFRQQPYVYFYHTYDRGGTLENRVVRYTLTSNRFSNPVVLLDGIPAGSIHDGGRLKFGPDGCLYVTTGDASDSSHSQDLGSLSGKILRIADDGTVPADNPFADSPIYSFGHRNPEGLTWDQSGQLWETEHGSTATDELNAILPGHNYGWPIIRGDQTADGLETPVLNSGSATWAPSGLAYRDGSLFFAGLRGTGLYEVKLPPTSVIKYLDGAFGRLREVVVGPDGNLYLLTSNRDGRGNPVADDDRLIRVEPGLLPGR